MYSKGQGVTQDYKQAFYWYKKAAKQGNAGAQLNLGFMYSKGQGVPQNHKQAFYWFKKAAEQGQAIAQNNLGRMYYNGQGTLQNFIYAYSWWNVAAANDNKTAVELRDLVLKKMSPDQVAQAQQLSAKMAQKITQRKIASE